MNATFSILIMEPQITCLYDMDIVFQMNGNFDEVYLYVRIRIRMSTAAIILTTFV